MENLPISANAAVTSASAAHTPRQESDATVKGRGPATALPGPLATPAAQEQLARRACLPANAEAGNDDVTRTTPAHLATLAEQADKLRATGQWDALGATLTALNDSLGTPRAWPDAATLDALVQTFAAHPRLVTTGCFDELAYLLLLTRAPGPVELEALLGRIETRVSDTRVVAAMQAALLRHVPATLQRAA